MSKSGVRWKTTPAVHLDDEDAGEEELATIPEVGDPEMCPAETDGLELEESAVGGAAAAHDGAARHRIGRGAIVGAMPGPGAIFCATPDTAAMTPVMAVPMGAATLDVAADANAGLWYAAVVALAAAAPTVMSSPSAGAAGKPGAGAATLESSASGAAGESGLGAGLAHLRLRRLPPPVMPFAVKGGDWLEFQARFDAT
ncbi:unnamed protein product [Lampetra planeri]